MKEELGYSPRRCDVSCLPPTYKFIALPDGPDLAQYAPQAQQAYNPELKAEEDRIRLLLRRTQGSRDRRFKEVSRETMESPLPRQRGSNRAHSAGHVMLSESDFGA
jgi:hypothetical protein